MSNEYAYLQNLSISDKVEAYKDILRNGGYIYAYRWVSWSNGENVDVILSMYNSEYDYEEFETNTFMSPRVLGDGNLYDEDYTNMIEREALHFNDMSDSEDRCFECIESGTDDEPFTAVRLRHR